MKGGFGKRVACKPMEEKNSLITNKLKTCQTIAIGVTRFNLNNAILRRLSTKRL